MTEAEYGVRVVVESITRIKTLVPRSQEAGYAVAWKATEWYQIKAYDPLDLVSNQMGVTSVFFVALAGDCPQIGEEIVFAGTSPVDEVPEAPSDMVEHLGEIETEVLTSDGRQPRYFIRRACTNCDHKVEGVVAHDATVTLLAGGGGDCPGNPEHVVQVEIVPNEKF